eukprot:8295246-Heterocapsa_arctica.AAC.1
MGRFADLDVKDDVPESMAAGMKIISSRWLLKRKKADVRARVVAQEINDGSPCDTFPATPTSIGRRLLVALAIRRGWTIELGDVSTAFLYTPLDDEVCVRPPCNL